MHSPAFSASKQTLVLGACVLTLLAMLILALGIGAVYIAPAEVVQRFISGDRLIWRYRVPRALVGTLAGAGMAVAGCLLQRSLRNPLAAPDTLGITAGGGVAAVLALLGGGVLPAQSLTAVAFCGALTGAGLIFLLSGKDIANPVRLALTGIAVSVGLSALTHLLLVRAAPEAGAAMTWLKGSLYARTLPDALIIAPIITAGIGVAILLSRHLDLLQLSDAAMAGVGMNARLWRLSAVLLAILCGSAAVAATGVLGFAGLIVPHLARILVGNKLAIKIPVSAIIGASLVVGCDAIGRWIFSPTEIPVGALIAIVGAPYFVYLLMRMSTRKTP